jgi:hypothetical protein
MRFFRIFKDLVTLNRISNQMENSFSERNYMELIILILIVIEKNIYLFLILLSIKYRKTTYLVSGTTLVFLIFFSKVVPGTKTRCLPV